MHYCVKSRVMLLFWTVTCVSAPIIAGMAGSMWPKSASKTTGTFKSSRIPVTAVWEFRPNASLLKDARGRPIRKRAAFLNQPADFNCQRARRMSIMLKSQLSKSHSMFFLLAIKFAVPSSFVPQRLQRQSRHPPRSVPSILSGAELFFLFGLKTVRVFLLVKIYGERGS